MLDGEGRLGGLRRGVDDPPWTPELEQRRRRRRRAAYAIYPAVVIALVGVLAAGSLRPDALDDLSEDDRAMVREAMGIDDVCDVPWARVTSVEIVLPPEQNGIIRWTCRWSILPWPRHSDYASCTEGVWFHHSPSDQNTVTCSPRPENSPPPEKWEWEQ